ncbi:MAG: DMT family transporter [Burkholderiaceae bacterium]
MSARPIAPWVGLALIAGIAVLFASNHVAARLAFDHGTGVVTAVAVRSAVTALAVAALLRATGTPWRLAPATRHRALIVGAVVAVQSVCLYSAVARIPVALALLTFNSFPVVLALLSWASGGERPARRTAIAMPVILAGLVLALDVPGVLASGGRSLDDPVRFAAGVGFGLAASLSFATVLLLTTRWLGEVDGRVRTVWSMTTVAVLAGLGGTLGGGFAWPVDAPGWAGLALLTVLYGTAFTSLFVVLPRLGTVNSAPAMNLEPIASMGIAWAVLGQAIGPGQAVGAVLVVGAIVWSSLGAPPRRG